MVRIILVFLLIILISKSSVLGEGSIVISVTDYPPLTSEKNFDGLGHGIYTDIVIAIVKKAGYRPVLKFYPLKRMLNNFVKGEKPFISTSLKSLIVVGVNPKELDILTLGSYSQYFFYYKSHLKEEVKFKKYSDLSKYRIGVILGSYIIPTLKKSGIEVYTSTNEGCAKMLANKRFDIWGSIELTAVYYTKKFYPEKLKDFHHTAPTKNSKDDMLLASFKSDLSAHKKFINLNKAFQTLKKDGTVMSIFKRYWGGEVPKDTLPDDMK